LEDQYEVLNDRGLNVSGLIRDLLGDYLSESVIAIQVSDETKHLYDRIVANTGATDKEVEVHLRVALAKVLKERIGKMQELQEKLEREAGGV
jgi:hypothetical protein